MKSLLQKTLDDLAQRVRVLPSGAKSLAHVCVVVPTSQSSRRLRRALAERFGAVIPPLVKTPSTFLVDEKSATTRGDELLAFAAALKAQDPAAPFETRLERARDYVDLRALLAPKALTFQDVASVVEKERPDEFERWRVCADLEANARRHLRARGKEDRLLALQQATFDHPEIEEILRVEDIHAQLPPDPAPSPLVPFASITRCASPQDEAERIASFFAAVKDDEAYPALSVADSALFPEIESAFKAKGLKIHNPAATRLITSSLGHLVAQIVTLKKTRDYATFSAFLRSADIRRHIQRKLALSDEDITAALNALDHAQAKLLPETLTALKGHLHGKLRLIVDFVDEELSKKPLRALLASIFHGIRLDERRRADREFVAAAETVNALMAECLPDDDRDDPEAEALFSLRLREETYELEPDAGDVILTDGWMELGFLETPELVIAGFCEGCVPESTVGHPFLPDSLRHRLGLADNDAKEKRDRAILRFALESRAPGAVKIFFHAVDAKGDAQKPSRLLFETDDDKDLARRVTRFYGEESLAREDPPYALPPSWRLDLPIPAEDTPLLKTSPSDLDAYLRCPFTYYVRRVIGKKKLSFRAEELDASEYGNLAHESLEAFAGSPVKDSDDAEEIRRFLQEQVDDLLASRFGTNLPAIVWMQGESVKRRLADFAAIQAARRQRGWVIRHSERKLAVSYFPSADDPARRTLIEGKCDRIDYNERENRWCVIDYKTWDGPERIDAASVQLPLYCAMLTSGADADVTGLTRENLSAAYCVLGKTAESVVFTDEMDEPCVFRGDDLPEVETKIKDTIRRIERGIFWPPGKKNVWKADYGKWLHPSPEETVSETWIRDQEGRLDEPSH